MFDSSVAAAVLSSALPGAAQPKAVSSGKKPTLKKYTNLCPLSLKLLSPSLGVRECEDWCEFCGGFQQEKKTYLKVSDINRSVK